MKNGLDRSVKTHQSARKGQWVENSDIHNCLFLKELFFQSAPICPKRTITPERVATAQGTVPDAPVYLRDIAHDLERTLLRDPESAVHWVAVVNEPDTFGPPTSLWEHDDCLLQVSLAQGHSEGMLVYVFAQANRCKRPGNTC